MSICIMGHMEETSARIRSFLSRLKPESFWRSIEGRAEGSPAFASLALHLRTLDARRSPKADALVHIASEIETLLRQGESAGVHATHTASHEGADSCDGALAVAAEVVAAKAAVRLVEVVFDEIVAETMRLGEKMSYWEDQAVLPELFVVQDAPVRLASLLFSGSRDWRRVRYLARDSRGHLAHKVDGIRRLRDRHALWLGKLAELSELTSSHAPARRIIAECVRLLIPIVTNSAVTPGGGVPTDAPVVAMKPASAAAPEESESDTRALTEQLVLLARASTELRGRLQALSDEFSRPPALERYWLPVTTVAVVGYLSVSSAVVRRRDIAQYAVALRDSAQNILREWVVRPAMHIYSIVRYDRSDIQLLGARSLQSDVESLERMVTDYARDVLSMTPAELAAVGIAAREGDLSPVMYGYEKDIKAPVKALVLGTMLRTLLIQVQKTKVDIEKAMASLDKLMRANELNFELLATIPALWAMRFLYTKGSDMLRRRSGLRSKSYHDRIRLLLRDAERMINNASTLDPPKSPMEVEGHVLIMCHELRVLARNLPRGETRRTFLEDVRDVELLRGDGTRRLRVLERMARTHAFLRP